MLGSWETDVGRIPSIVLVVVSGIRLEVVSERFSAFARIYVRSVTGCKKLGGRRSRRGFVHWIAMREAVTRVVDPGG